MPVSEHYIAFVHDLHADFEPLRIKRMFGGAGIYSGDLFFAILVEDTLYLKVDDGNRGAYQDRGIQPFSYEGKNGRRATMSYYPVPSELLDDPDALAPWARQAIDERSMWPSGPPRSGVDNGGLCQLVSVGEDAVATHPPTGWLSPLDASGIALRVRSDCLAIIGASD
jgi:DNA transformation protein